MAAWSPNLPRLAVVVLLAKVESASRNWEGVHVSKSVEGSCLCGAAANQAIADEKYAIQSYCRDCQHISGGAKLPQIAVPSDGFVSTGNAKVYDTTSDTGNTVRLTFCGDCGSPLHKSTS